MIDVNKITSTLAKLPDQQLQQYAQMHKNDPYIMALAMSESNRRKEMRSAGQGGMQEQPKVVDQMVAEMAPQQLPEEMGIGQLPAGEMNFAGGGIIAFADGGDVERYQFGGSTMDGFMPSGAQQDLASQATDLVTNERTRNAAAAKIAELRQQVNELQFTAPELIPSVNAQIAALTASTASKAVPSPTDPNFRRQPDPRAAGANTFAESVKAVSAAPTVDTTRKGPRPTPAATGPAEDKNGSGLNALINNFTRQTDLAQGELRNRRVGLASQLEQEALGAKEEGEKRRKERGDVFASREARLAAREGELTGMKDKHLGLALLQAGASMMTTPGNLGMALGKGVQVGSERYIAGIDKINAAKDKFAEARDRRDELRLNRDDMNEKEIREENRAIRNARLQGQQLFLDGATNDLKISNDNQKAIFGVAAESMLTDKRVAGQLAAARISAAPQTPAQMQIALALGNGDLEAGLNKIKAIEAGKFSVSNSYADYLKAFAGKEGLTPPMSFANYAAQFGATLPR